MDNLQEDLREKLISDFTHGLLGLKDTTLSPSDINMIKNLLIIQMDKYEIQNRCTDIVPIDTSSEKLLNIYSGVLLTRGKSVNTVKVYCSILRKFMYEVDKSFVDVKHYDVLTWIAKKQQTISLRTCECYRAYLSSFYKWLFEDRFISENPMERIKTINYDKGIKKEFSEVEIDKLRASCETLRDRALFEFLLSSGVRISEASNMDISDIDFQDLSVIVRKGKGNKSRKTYISKLCASYLKEYINTREIQSNCLFVSKRKTRLTKRTMQSDFKRIGKIANVENVHPHRCRRTFATMLIKKGMDIHTIQKLMGHENINTTVEYLSISDDFIRNEYNRYM